MSLYNNDTGYRVAQDKDCKAQLLGIALAKLVAHMEDLWKEEFTSIYTNRPHKVVQESAQAAWCYFWRLDTLFKAQRHFSICTSRSQCSPTRLI